MTLSTVVHMKHLQTPMWPLLQRTHDRKNLPEVTRHERGGRALLERSQESQDSKNATSLLGLTNFVIESKEPNVYSVGRHVSREVLLQFC